MKTAITKSAFAGLLILATPAFAQEERLATINFVGGDNGGALAVAESIYGKSSIMETAILDVDEDANAEIAVKFSESCKGDVCAMAVLKYAEAQWKPIIEDVTSSLSISSSANDGYRTLNSAHIAVWEWNGSQYFPKPVVDTWTYDFEEASLTSTELSDRQVSQFSSPKAVSFDEYKVVSSQSQFDCVQVSICPAVIFKDGKKIGSLFSQGGTLGFKDGDFFTIEKHGYSKYALSAQSLRKVDIKRAGTRISEYQK